MTPRKLQTQQDRGTGEFRLWNHRAAQGQTEKSQPEKGKWTQMLPLMDKVFAVNTRKKEKLRVFQGTIIDCINHTPGKVPTQEQLTNTNKGHVFLVRVFFPCHVKSLTCWGFLFRLFVCLLVSLFFICVVLFFRERLSWMSREVGRNREELGRV